MKYYLNLTILLFSFLIFSLSIINAKTTIPLIGKLIVVDPGHGGVDPGTLYGEIYEKNLNLKISKYLKKELEKYGATIIMTREDDYDLSKPNALYRKKSDFDNRIKFINESMADLYLSIHLNYLENSSYYGPQVFYKKKDKNLASKVQDVLNKQTKTDRNIKLIPSDTYMYHQLQVPGLLIECGFLSNLRERTKLNTTKYQQEIAKSIAKAIVIYFT